MEESLKSYRELMVWQRSKAFAVGIYRHTEDFPATERYGIASQMRRAAVAIPSDIAEGWRRHSSKDQLHFLRMAYGSGAELETQLEISKDLGYLEEDVYKGLISEIEEIMRMLNRIVHNLEKKLT